MLALALNLPIPWLLGSLSACALGAWAGLPMRSLPGTLERWMRVAIGVALGPAVAASLGGAGADLPFAIAAAVGVTLVAVVLGTLWFERSARLARPSAFLAALPGGLSMLLALAGELGTRREQVVLIHTVRVVLVVLSLSLLARALGVPPVAHPLAASLALTSGSSWPLVAALIVGGYLLCERVPLAGAHVILPMIVTAALAGFTDLALTPPPIVKSVAMLVFGIVLGSEIRQGPRASYARLAGASALYSAMVMSLGALVALALARLVEPSFLVLFLALAPGGIAEVSLVALALGLDAGLVALVHSCRFLCIVLAGPLGLRWLARRQRASDDAGS